LTLTLDRVEVTLVRICGRGLPTHQIRWKSEKLFVDVRTDTPEFQSTRSSVGDDLKTKASFSCLLWHPAWKRRGPILVSALHKSVTYLFT